MRDILMCAALLTAFVLGMLFATLFMPHPQSMEVAAPTAPPGDLGVEMTPARLLLNWDQCDAYFWPQGGAPEWGCICKMRPLDVHAPLDFRTDGAIVPPGLSLKRSDATLLGASAGQRTFALASKRPAKEDEPVLTHDAFVMRRARSDGSLVESLPVVLDGQRVGGASARQSHARPVGAELSLESHGLPLEGCGHAIDAERRHYFEGLGEMLNHGGDNATTTVCQEVFEVEPRARAVTRYLMVLCATRDLPRGFELTSDYREWQPTGALNKGHYRSGAWIAEMLKRSPFGNGRQQRRLLKQQQQEQQRRRRRR